MRQYLAELNKFPRDLPIDGRTASAVFVRVFGLSGKTEGVADPAALKQFADEWYGYISTVPAAGHDIPLPVAEPPKAPAGGGSPKSDGGRP